MSSHSWAKHRGLLRTSKNDTYYRVSQWITYPHLVEMWRRVWGQVADADEVVDSQVGEFALDTGWEAIDEFDFQRREA